MLALDLREWEEIARLTQTNSKQKIELTHRYIKDLFIKFQVVEQKSHTLTKISIIRNLLLSYCKTFQTNQIHTQKQADKKI